MKNLALISLTLLISAPLIAMEGQWNQTEEIEQKSGQQEEKVPTLANLCLQKLASNVQSLKTFPYNSHPRLGVQVWEYVTPAIIARENNALVYLCFSREYPPEVQAAMVKKLLLTEKEASTLFNQTLSASIQEYTEGEKYLVACALFAKNPVLQTWENGMRLASTGPITLEAAHAIIQTIGTMDNLYTLFKENESVLPEEMLQFGNDQLFEQAFYELEAEKCTLFDLNSVRQFIPHLIPSYDAPDKTSHKYSLVNNANYAAIVDEYGKEIIQFPEMTITNFTITDNKKWCFVYSDEYYIPWIYIINLEKQSGVGILHFEDNFDKDTVQKIYFDEESQHLCIKEENHLPVAASFPWYYLKNDMTIRDIAICLLSSGMLPVDIETLRKREKYIHQSAETISDQFSGPRFGKSIFIDEREENRKIAEQNLKKQAEEREQLRQRYYAIQEKKSDRKCIIS